MADQPNYVGTLYSQGGNYYQQQGGNYVQINANQVPGGLTIGSGGYDVQPIPTGAMTTPIGSVINGQKNTGAFTNTTPTTPGTTTGSAITSSMVGPALSNFNNAVGQATTENDNTYTASVNSANATNTAAQAAIVSQVAQGSANLNQQAQGIVKQAQGISDNLTATLAANSPSGGFGSTAAADYQNKLNQGTQQSLAMISQAQQLLSLQGTAEEQQANATAASQIMTAAQNHMNNVLSLAQQTFSASTQAATSELQAAQYDQQTQAYNDGLQQYQDGQNTAALNFTSQNNITTPYFTSGGQVYSSSTLQPVDPKTLQAQGISLTDPKMVGSIPDTSNKQLLTNFATSYPDAGINPSTDTIASAQQKIKSSQIYKAAVSSGYGTSSAPKPVGQLLTVQQASGMPTTQFNYVTNLVQGYLSQHPQLWNLSTANSTQIAQSEQEVLNTLQSDPNLSGYTYNQIWPIVSYLFSPDPNAWVQNYKVNIGTSNYSIGQSGGTGTISIGSGADNGATNLPGSGSGNSGTITLPNIPDIGG